MTEKQFKNAMTSLVKMCHNENVDYKKVIAKAVNLGMKYQEEKIKQGINIVFSELNNYD